MHRPRRSSVLAASALLLAAGLWLATHVREPPPAPSRLLFGRWQTRNLIVALGLLWLAGGILCASAYRRAGVHFLVATVSFGVVWGALEVAGIAGWVSYAHLLGNAEHEEPQGRSRVPHVDLSGTAREDLADAWDLARPRIPYRFKTDSDGFRNEPDRASTDVVCLGDSFLVDGLVPHEAMVTARLEGLLGRSVRAIALVGIGPQEEAELLAEVHPELEGRLLLHFVFEGNDLLDSAGYYALKEGMAPPPGEEAPSWKERTLANQLVLHLQVLTDPDPGFLRHRRGWIGREPYYFQWLRQSFEGLEGEIPRITKTLGEIRRSVESAGGRYALVLVPEKMRVLGPLCRFDEGSEIADWKSQCGPLPEALRAWAADNDVPFVDLTEALRASARAGAIPWFQADTHWNEIGHRVAAEAIATSAAVRTWAGTR